MPKVKPAPRSEAVNRRFFLAIEQLVVKGKISSLGSFCELNSLSSPRYREMRLQFGVTPKLGYISRYKHLEVEAICIMVANYPISARWLLTGRGNMLTEKV